MVDIFYSYKKMCSASQQEQKLIYVRYKILTKSTTTFSVSKEQVKKGPSCY